jgi:hypothetical protein
MNLRCPECDTAYRREDFGRDEAMLECDTCAVELVESDADAPPNRGVAILDEVHRPVVNVTPHGQQISAPRQSVIAAGAIGGIAGAMIALACVEPGGALDRGLIAGLGGGAGAGVASGLHALFDMARGRKP